MKILHVFDYFSPLAGGTVSVLHNLTRGMVRSGHQVTIYTSDFKLDKSYITSLTGVKIYPYHCISSLGLFFVTPSLVMAAKQHLKEFDIIQLGSLKMQFFLKKK